MIRAAELYDFRRGIRFSTYASWWIRQGVVRALADQARAIRLPARVMGALTRVVRTEAFLESETGRKPTVEAITTEAGVAVQQVVRLGELVAQEPVSLDAPLAEGALTTLGELIADRLTLVPEDDVSDESLVVLVSLLRCLAAPHHEIVVLRWGLDGYHPHARSEIAAKLGLSTYKVTRLEQKATALLQELADEQRQAVA